MDELDQYIDITIDRATVVEALVKDPTFLVMLAQALAQNPAARLILERATQPPVLSKINDTVVRQGKSSNRPIRS